MIWNERIRDLRERSRLTLLEVSKRLGVSEATAQRYESGSGIKNIPYEQIVKYAQIFNVSPAYIMGWDDEPVSTADLTKDEVTLLRVYRELNREGKDKLLERCAELKELGYKRGSQDFRSDAV